MKKILLIGSTGFIGKKLKKELNKDYDLICPIRKNGFDITKKNTIKKYLNDKIDVVINLSGQQNKNSNKMVDTIYNGNLHIIEISKKIKKKLMLIYISTSLVYGNNKTIQNEKSKINPINLYEKTKYKIEKKYFKQSKNFLVLRFCNIYGNSSKTGIIKLILDAIKNKRLFKFDNLNTFKNFIHVDDVIKIISYLIKKNIKNKVLNVGNENINFKDLARFLSQITQNRFRFQNKDININLTLTQKINNRLIKNIMKKYIFKSLKKYLKNEIKNK